ncbi:MAG: hypothetical protein KAR08_01485 [Candidatus Heimdallarchaeota archaeon]|nr:hypothetical protein [Candidatus Heimdallarchaeota archaeon]
MRKLTTRQEKVKRDVLICLVIFILPIGIFFLSGYINASQNLGWNISSPINSPMSAGLEDIKEDVSNWMEKIDFLQKPIFNWAMSNNLLALFLFYSMIIFVLSYVYVDRMRLYKTLGSVGKWFIIKEK